MLPSPTRCWLGIEGSSPTSSLARKLVAAQAGHGVARKVEQLIVRLAEENRDWGYDRIAGALANLGYRVCDQTVGNVLQRHGLPPAPERKRTTTWSAFIRTHLALLAGTDFFTAEVLTLRGLMTYYVLFFIPFGQKTHLTAFSCGLLMIITQEPAQSLAALDRRSRSRSRFRGNSRPLPFPWWLRSSW